MTPSDGHALLIVDDEEEIRNVVALIARATCPGTKILTAPDAESAEATCMSEPVAAVLTDLRMPGRSGIELVQRLHAAKPLIRCALMTGFVDDTIDGVQLAHLNVVAVLRKPFPMAECQRVFESLLAGPDGPPR